MGKSLSLALLEDDHEVIAVGSSVKESMFDHPRFKQIVADTTSSGHWQEELREVEVVINLAGKTIFHLWSKKYKQQIHDSRIYTTKHLVEALPQNREIMFLSASAAGYYGDRADHILNESEPQGEDFLGRLCRDWEAEAQKAGKKKVRVLVARFGVVIGKDGGAMSKMFPAYRFWLGGPLGDGKQWFPWIHIDDLVAAVKFMIKSKDIQGVFNFCSPIPVRNRDLARTIGDILHKPSSLRIPAFFLRTFLGEFGTFLLFSQRAVPDNLLKQGFEFKFPDFRKAISDILV